ncbi:polyprenyl synthetase family protein [Dellaglioa sp. BT-FLS60]
MISLATFSDSILPEFNHKLLDRLQELDTEKNLKKAMIYSVEAGGKRMRPLLIFVICQMLDRDIDDSVYSVAGALELIHTYSLIHDDLPAMDNDNLRRGKATNHIVFGESIAILAGDALNTLAFEWLSQAKLPDSQKMLFVSQLARLAGPEGMVGGQVADIEGEQKALSLAQLKKVHKRKTGDLIEFAVYAGGILGKATTDQQTLLIQYGRHFGLAFQIYDDIMDVVGTSKEMGKAVHKDSQENKNTYPGLMGLNGAYDTLEKVINQAKATVQSLKQTGLETGYLEELLHYFKFKN